MRRISRTLVRLILALGLLALTGMPQFAARAATICTGCSVHNCYFQAVGAPCISTHSQQGRCRVDPNICPTSSEPSCICAPI